MSLPKPAARRIPRGRPALILAAAAMVTAGCGASTSQAAGTSSAAAAGFATGVAAPPVFVITSLLTGRRSTIVLAASRPGYGTVGVTNLAWAPDDTHHAAPAPV
jgi:uncharacterized protein (DUF2345 family)